MSLLQNRMQGLGSDGSKPKVWKCPDGHLLEPFKAPAGTCDGCKARVKSGDCVMDCRKCNWYLCQRCHPQDTKPRSWIWGSVSFFADKASQEMQDLKEVADNLETMGPLAACTAPRVGKGPGDDGEIRVVEEPAEVQGTGSGPCTPVATAQPQNASTKEEVRGQSTPPKTGAPKEEPMVDLLDLEFEPKVEKAPAPAHGEIVGDAPLLD